MKITIDPAHAFAFGGKLEIDAAVRYDEKQAAAYDNEGNLFCFLDDRFKVFKEETERPAYTFTTSEQRAISPLLETIGQELKSLSIEFK